MIKIAVIDDHALILEAIKYLLSNNKEYCYAGGFFSVSDFLNFHTQSPVDFLLLDINLNGEDGLTACKILKEKFPNLKIIMLTSLNQPSLVMGSFRAGASGFLLKNTERTELLAALNQVKTSGKYLHSEISFTEPELKTPRFEWAPKLSRREKDVLKLILEEYTTQEIAKFLSISPNTVESHRASLLSKSGAKNVVGLIRFTIENNWLESQE